MDFRCADCRRRLRIAVICQHCNATLCARCKFWRHACSQRQVAPCESEPTHLADPQRMTFGNWPDVKRWPAAQSMIAWNGVEPMTLCSRPVRFVRIADGNAATCEACLRRRRDADAQKKGPITELASGPKGETNEPKPICF